MTKKFFVKPDLYLMAEIDSKILDQADVVLICDAFCSEFLLPYLQKWSKTKAFQNLKPSVGGTPGDFDSFTFCNLKDLIKARSKKK
jgi:hypothetical protein